MKCYCIKHVPIGLYYMPAREIQAKIPGTNKIEYVKSNLGKKGKIYTQKPTLKWLGSKYYTHFINSSEEIHRGSRGKLKKVNPVEWVIEET